MTRLRRIGDGKDHALAEAVVGERDVLARNEQARLDHVLRRHAFLAEMLLEREALGGGVAEPELERRRRIDAAVGEIAARAGAGARGERGLEEFGRQLDDVDERLSALVAPGIGLGIFRQRHARLLGEPLDRFRKRDPFGEHDEIEDVAVLAGGEVEPHRLLVIDEERGRALLIERREPAPLAPGLFELHAPADDVGDRKPRAELFEELGGEVHAGVRGVGSGSGPGANRCRANW